MAFISALCLGCYDISKKIALRDNRVIDVLTLSICFSACMLLVPLLLSRLCPQVMEGTHFFVPRLDARAHLFTLLKSVIVLSSWVFAYISLKHLPLSVVSPMQATRPMWTLLGALLIFHEHLNTFQWLGVILALGTVFVFSFSNRHIQNSRNTRNTQNPPNTLNIQNTPNKYYLSLALAIILGSCSGLYDKYLMRYYDHNAVQVYYTLYQSLMMLLAWIIINKKNYKLNKNNYKLSTKNSPTSFNSQLSTLNFTQLHSTLNTKLSTSFNSQLHSTLNTKLSTSFNSQLLLTLKSIKNIGVIAMISVFLIISDNVYMLALRDPASMIAIVSTIRRGGAVIGFAYGLIFLHESDVRRKVLCMLGILAGLICLAFGSI